MGFLVELEGIDGSGKGTQAALLAERARAAGRSVETFTFPTYDGNPFAEAIAGYLNGEFGSADEVHPELAALLYAADRFHTRGALRDVQVAFQDRRASRAFRYILKATPIDCRPVISIESNQVEQRT